VQKDRPPSTADEVGEGDAVGDQQDGDCDHTGRESRWGEESCDTGSVKAAKQASGTVPAADAWVLVSAGQSDRPDTLPNGQDVPLSQEPVQERLHRAFEADADKSQSNVLSVSGELKQRAVLHKDSALTDQEFEAAKAMAINVG
jgi:hypothetical protein